MANEKEPGTGEPMQESVVVEIYDQQYHLRGVDTDHIIELARFVDGKMRKVAEQSATADSLRVAVLAALNIADELAQVRDSQKPEAVRGRAETLNSLLDEVLGDGNK